MLWSVCSLDVGLVWGNANMGVHLLLNLHSIFCSQDYNNLDNTEFTALSPLHAQIWQYGTAATVSQSHSIHGPKLCLKRDSSPGIVSGCGAAAAEADALVAFPQAQCPSLCILDLVLFSASELMQTLQIDSSCTHLDHVVHSSLERGGGGHDRSHPAFASLALHGSQPPVFIKVVRTWTT